MQREKPPEWREKQKGSRGIRRGQRYRLVFQFPIREQKPDLSAVRFGAIGIGSREYDTFCGAIDKLEAELKNSGAKQTGETLKINILDHDIPEDPAEEWLGSWINLLK
ncbi:flavodoxin domain-containing protein, partial [Escherichia coli]|uniref:flavodoxin domain-containing protein n=1 Tax=Escherichia coli TaxID=562 RepID=UPI000DA5B284